MQKGLQSELMLEVEVVEEVVAVGLVQAEEVEVVLFHHLGLPTLQSHFVSVLDYKYGNHQGDR
jgi:hypothetical protein